VSVRVDVLQRFEAAAEEMLVLQDTYVACVTRDAVESGGEWSLPVQMRFVRREQLGLIDIEVRELRLVGIEPA
jgi:hypothetical protein